MKVEEFVYKEVKEIIKIYKELIEIKLSDVDINEIIISVNTVKFFILTQEEYERNTTKYTRIFHIYNLPILIYETESDFYSIDEINLNLINSRDNLTHSHYHTANIATLICHLWAKYILEKSIEE